MGVPSSRLRALTRRLHVSRLLATVALSALGAITLFSGGSVNVVSAADETVTITATNVDLPKNLTVTPGSTVTWRPIGGNPHSITSDGCVEPMAGACTFDSGATAATFISGTGARNSYAFKFDNAGIYQYFCRVHGAPGGVGHSGTVTVMPTSALIPTGAPPAKAADVRPNVSVYVVSPANGAMIAGDRVTVQLGANGATVRAPVFGEVSRTAGHFNLLLDTEVNLSTQIQAVSGVTRSNTTTATLENVRPGPHTLTVVWTYDNNVSPQPPITSVLRFTTTAGGGEAPAAGAPPAGLPAVRPPSTGDAGLASNSAAPWYIASAGFMLLAAAGIVTARKRA